MKHCSFTSPLPDGGIVRKSWPDWRHMRAVLARCARFLARVSNLAMPKRACFTLPLLDGGTVPGKS